MKEKPSTPTTVTSPNRRQFLKSAAATGGVLSSSLLASNSAFATNGWGGSWGNQGMLQERAYDAFRTRVASARTQLLETLQLDDQETNNDQSRYRDERYYGSFSKTLPHNQYGEVNPNAFRRMARALRTGREYDFNRIPLASNAVARLANPQGAFRVALAGADSHATRIKAAPSFRSAESASEMGEVYWLAITRDVPFKDYQSSSLISEAVSDLNGFSKIIGPTVSGQITANSVFRGETPGDLAGPYISQLLHKDVNYGPTLIEQRYLLGTPGNNFMTDVGNWLNIQRGGAVGETLVTDSTRRYIFNNRGLAEYVHGDALFQAYFNAALVLLGYGGDAIDQDNPYRSQIVNQGGFTTFGPPFLFDLLTQAANLSLSGAWFQKWRMHRRLRPEAYGGRVHFHLQGARNYELHSDILNSQALNKVYSDNGSYLLPMCYVEGSPTHPSYPAGHATVAGACCTILKAFFNEDFVIPDPVEANNDGSALLDYTGTELTLGNEVNKLAANISLGRDAAGVHYRSDGIEGIAAGEQQALALLQDYSMTINESFAGFKLKRFDGSSVRIVDGNIIG